MKASRKQYFKALPFLPGGRALLLRALMLPNYLLTSASGLENLSRAEGAFIYAFNHNNSLEALLVPVFLFYHLGGRTISFVIDWMYGKIPLLGTLMNMIDPVYVYSKRSSLFWIEANRPSVCDLNTVERCTEKLLSGKSIGIFPEGTRNRNPETLIKGKPGIGHIAMKSGAAVIPVGIDFHSRKTKGKIPVIGRIIIRIGAPLHFAQHSEAYQSIIADSSSAISGNLELHRIAADVTCEIMLALAELSGKRYSVSSPSNQTRLNEANLNPKEERLCPV
ncbi:MAG: 1-acyl-sn-glycerol-3-phosphate acyltransferase [Chlorobiaceae bacterium]|nr:1-acyl-sn-glycerol-3-phosphate acyltransferase [Chlorobiaceae bacterium]